MKNTLSLQSFIPTSLHPFIPFFLLLLIPSSLLAQIPQGIPYQAVIRDNAGAPLVNTPILVRFTLHQNTTDGAIEYQETQSATTNAFGVINTQFGTGTPSQGTFAGIVWSNTSKFIQVEANDGNGYVDMGTQQMMSVPYAMYAGSAGNQSFPNGSTNGEMLYWDTVSSSWMTVPAGVNGQAMYFCDGVPTWGGCPIEWMPISSIVNSNSNVNINGGINNLNGNVINSLLFQYYNINNSQTIYSAYVNVNGSLLSIELTGLIPGNYVGNFSISNSGGSIYTSDTVSFSIVEIIGCMDTMACNFLQEANLDNGNCKYSGDSCLLSSSNSVYDGECTCQELIYSEGEGVFDIDGNYYSSIVINNQEWMKSNLKVSKYQNGDIIQSGFDISTWSNLINGAYTTYNYSNENDSMYGKLYNWYAVNDIRGICPTGWHTPNIDEWTLLESNIGGANIAGGRMKPNFGWNTPNPGSSNLSGFTALPGGFIYSNVDFIQIGQSAVWWSTSQYDSNTSWCVFIENAYSNLFHAPDLKENGFSVRCLKD